jgi:hypothetical protein
LALFCGLLGCSSGPVSESSVRTAYEKSTKAIAEGKAKLVSFRKVNARSAERLGVQFYEVEYEAVLDFLEDYPQPGQIPLGPKGKKGETKQETGKLSFQKTENGWKGPDKNLY